MDLADPQHMHGYSYANNTPITQSDPHGLDPGGGQRIDQEREEAINAGTYTPPFQPTNIATADRRVKEKRKAAAAAFVLTFTDDHYACRYRPALQSGFVMLIDVAAVDVVDPVRRVGAATI